MMRFEFPLPPKECHPNGRYHWRVKALHVAEYRGTVKILALDQRGRGSALKEAVIQAEFVFALRRCRDTDNMLAWLKPAFDGLVDAKILVDDNKITHLPVQYRKVQNDEKPHVVLTVEKTGAV